MKRDEQDKLLIDWLDRHRGLLSKVTRSFARSSHDQSDLYQEITVQIWKSIPKYRPVVKESTWMYRVALYTAMNWSRKERRTKFAIDEQEIDRVAAVQPATAEDSRLEWLYDKIAELDPVNRSLALLMLEGCSYREISDALGISESNVGVRINRIKNKWTSQLEQEKLCER